jgi:PKD repeat protein
MKNRLIFRNLMLLMLTAFYLSSCNEDETRPVFPISATIFHSVKEKQVAFTALTHSAVSWEWDFGDGKTSTEQNPVHVYEKGGYYKAALTATDASGNKATDEVELALNLSSINYLTGNPNAPGYKGKKWKLTTVHPANDKLANADATLKPLLQPLPNGAFGQIGLPEAYEGTYTFHINGSFTHEVYSMNGNGAVFSSAAHQLKINGGAGILKQSADMKSYPFVIAKFTPETGATFSYTENVDFTIKSVYTGGADLTYKGVNSLSFSGNEFIGFNCFERRVIVQEIKDNSMRLVMFASLDPKYYPIQTNTLVLSFEVVK